ncbi:MAG: phospho-sugar mutase [Bacteroidales bacterium]|jgi:phosphoglucomutase|nr:phospho-sugar mutase [Bacteroidales bacterium]
MENFIKEKINYWLSDIFDKETREKVKNLLENDENQIIDCFYKDLEFGTGGLRGIMDVGTNRMNKYTVGRATQGLANYLLKQFPNEEIKCAIGFDTRNNSAEFANISASILAANNIKVLLFEKSRPTPELSFAVRHYNCKAGIVITASHNPKEYNGYKVYWADGGQIIPPHDHNIIQEVNFITDFSKIQFQNVDNQNINIIGKELDEIYSEKILTLIENNKSSKNLSIVFSPIHGSTWEILPQVFEKAGYSENFYIVEEQSKPDGHFSSVSSPNPEEPATLSMAIELAKHKKADIVLGTDPDGDRLGVAVRNSDGEYILLNGNQTASLLTNYVLSQNKELYYNDFIVKTIVTTELLQKIAQKFDVKCYDVLTGFKYIAQIIEEKKGEKQFLCGGEESFGFLAGDFVRDKDAVIAALLITECANLAKQKNKNLLDILIDIYLELGFYMEGLKSITKKGKDGLKEIENMMINFRNNPPKTIINQNVTEIFDYEKLIHINIIENNTEKIDYPKSNVLQFVLEDATIITVRPSGTEPKIKFYISTKEILKNKKEFNTVEEKLKLKINNIFKKLI